MISDFSKGKTAKIFDDIKQKHSEYIVLKNNSWDRMVFSIIPRPMPIEEAMHNTGALLEKSVERLMRFWQ